MASISTVIMTKENFICLLKLFLVFALLLQFISVTYGSKKNFKDLTSSNQMEPIHSVRHMARLMRRVLAEDTDSDSNVTTLSSPSSESPAVTAVTTITTARQSSNPTFAASTSVIAETISQTHRDERTNQSINVQTSFNNGAFGIKCPGYLPCESLNVECIVCSLNESCVYGEDVSVSCEVKANINCQGTRSFKRNMNCRYCYQTPSSQHECVPNVTCKVISSPRQRYINTCHVLPRILCLGNREFYKNLVCNWSKGYSWSTALTLSIVLGGFGVDRFYLGMWQEGIGKLFSFGGLGVWTLVDVILIATGYLGPADGSLYIP